MGKELTKQALWDAVQEHGSVRAAGRALGMPESTIRVRLAGFTPAIPGYAFIPDVSDLPADHIGEDGIDVWDYWTVQQREKPKVRRYILTSAQNNCRVHGPFLKNLEALTRYLDAEMLVSFTVYDRAGYRGLVRQGETGIKRGDVWWDKAVQPYVTNDRCRLHRRLAFCGELDILATAKCPLSGLESYCGRSSIIVPHNRFAFQCVESRKHQMPKEMFTTGSVTVKRFIQRKTGQVAHFHHVLGALLVEVTDEGYWHVHHINADEDGNFYWLDKFVYDGKVLKNQEGIAGLILGDIHHEKMDDDQESVAWALAKTLKPDTIFVHDLIDFKSRNHHNRDDAIFSVQTLVEDSTVEDEIKEAGIFLETLGYQSPDSEVFVVASNHEDAYLRWIKETDWKDDVLNAEFYLQTALELVRAVHDGRGQINPLEWAVKRYHNLAPKAKFLQLDESREVAGVECGIHGHVGPSGSRGTPKAYSRLGFKTFTGHTHTPSIVDGCYTVGVSGRLDMEYNKGPSKWMHAHGLIYPNGKRAFLFVKNGKWRA